MPNKSKHTPTPWTTDGLEIISGECRVALCGQSMPCSEVQANAQLIAAAPDLLAVVQRCAEIAAGGVVQRHETGKPQWSALDEIKKITSAAITKATQ